MERIFVVKLFDLLLGQSRYILALNTWCTGKLGLPLMYDRHRVPRSIAEVRSSGLKGPSRVSECLSRGRLRCLVPGTFKLCEGIALHIWLFLNLNRILRLCNSQLFQAHILEIALRLREIPS